MTIATNMLCLMSGTDYDQISENKKVDIQPFYDAFQECVKSVRFISEGSQTTVEILAVNGLVEEVNKLLWYGIHDLVSRGSVSYLEVHNFDEDGNTIDIEKYLIDSVMMSIVKHSDDLEPQTIQITGGIFKEITIADPVVENTEDAKDE